MSTLFLSLSRHESQHATHTHTSAIYGCLQRRLPLLRLPLMCFGLEGGDEVCVSCVLCIYESEKKVKRR